jgi:hypothetical protein
MNSLQRFTQNESTCYPDAYEAGVEDVFLQLCRLHVSSLTKFKVAYKLGITCPKEVKRLCNIAEEFPQYKESYLIWKNKQHQKRK